MTGVAAGAGEIGWAVVIAGWAVALCVSDLRRRRLPDLLTLPAIPIVWGAAAGQAPMALLGGVAWALLYLMLAVGVGGVGGGDIKLAASLGVLVVWGGGVVGWLLALSGASLLSLTTAVLSRRSAVPHGPAMFAGSLFGAVLGGLP